MNPRLNPAIILLSAVTVRIIGCDRAASEKPATGPQPAVSGRVVFIGPSQDAPESEAVVAGARSIAARASYLRFEFLSPPATDRDMNSRMAGEAIRSGAAGVCVYLNNARDLQPLADELRGSGIVLVTMGAQPSGVSPYQHINIDLAGGAELIAENLPKFATGRKTYSVIHARSRSAIDEACYERFVSHRPGESVMVQVAERDVFNPSVPPSRAISDILVAFRSTAIVVTLDPEVWLTSEPPFALDEQRKFITLGAVEPLWARLRNGEAAALIGPLDGEIGAAAMQGMLRGLARESAPTPVRTIPCHLVTRDTLDEFAKSYQVATGQLAPNDSKGK
ncbi:MAG: hypothetical protein JNG88_00205 [Phycisphaerales bacterium]|nr:hypothetical protein [Phycisphaerales bacterium]